MPPAIRPVPRPWRELVLVCRKCTKKLDGGFGKGGRDSLRRVLRAELRAGGRRDVRVVAVNCLGVCPKRAVSVMRGSRPGEVLVVPAGTDPADILHHLL
jgi:predicted metal-binding protein